MVSRNSRVLGVVLCLGGAAFAADPARAQSGISVNGPVSLTQPSGSPPAAPPNSDSAARPTIVPEAASVSNPAAVSKSENPPAAEQSKAVKPAAEHRPLGPPPAKEKATQEPAGQARGDSSVLAKLDPRGSEIMRVLGALALVIGLLLITRTLLKRYGARGTLAAAGGRPSGIVEILARYPVARGQHLVLLKLARRVLLLHHSGATMTTLCEITSPNEVASLLARIEAGSTERSSAQFRSALTDFLSEHDSTEVRPVAVTKPAALPARTIQVRPAARKPQTEIIDLTRRSPGLVSGLLGKVVR